MSSFLRLYSPDACGKDGYPPEWHCGPSIPQVEEGGPCYLHPGVKNLVREDAGHRCVRCLHPYRKGQHGKGEWSPCDERCTHRGPVRLSYQADDGSRVENHEHDLGTEAGVVVGYGKQVDARWRILTVHHLNGVKWDLRWWNLVALCQRCHLQVQGKVQMERVYPWPHSDWFKPYVAGYYAWTYLGQEISRDEALERIDELLGLELAA